MLRFTSAARKNIEAILTYLNERSPAGARGVGRAIDKTAGSIGQFPDRGRLSGEADTRVVRVGRYPYLIHWRMSGADVWIIHIRHSARRPWHGEDE